MRPDTSNDTALPAPILDVWHVDIPPIDLPFWLTACRSGLAPQDMERLQQNRLPKGQAQFLFTRLVLRHLLSAYQPSVLPAQWRLLRNRHGRPVVDPVQTPLSFNLTHTGSTLLLAFSQFGDPGIDVESLQRPVDAQSVADRYFFPSEVSQLLQMAGDSLSQKACFLRLWTLKEASVKATGLGLSRALRKFEFGETGDGQLWYRLHQMSDTAMTFWSGGYNEFVVGLACVHRSAQPMPPVEPQVRRLRWPEPGQGPEEQIMPLDIRWMRCYNRNSSTNFEP